MFSDFWNRHRGKVIGAAIGLILGLLIVSFGILKALFIAICIFAGYLLGRKLDEGDWVRDFLSRFFKN